MNLLLASQIIEDENALVSRWVFPEDRFVEYEPKDEHWCRVLGNGREVWEPGAYQIEDVLVVHPKIMELIRKETQTRVDKAIASRVARLGSQWLHAL